MNETCFITPHAAITIRNVFITPVAFSLYHAGLVIISAHVVTSGSGMTHLLCVLLKETELEALVQLQLPDVPHLMKVLPCGVKLIQQTGHLANSRNWKLCFLQYLSIWS